jgi:hypothetical protein
LWLPHEYQVRAAKPLAQAGAGAPPPKPPSPAVLENTGQGGERPEPPYPPWPSSWASKATVELLLTADEAGVIISAEVKESSGSSILDRASVDLSNAIGRFRRARADGSFWRKLLQTDMNPVKKYL